MHPAALHRIRELPAKVLALLRLRPLEERGEGQIAEKSYVVGLVSRIVAEMAEFQLGHRVVRLPDAPPQLARPGQMLACPHRLESGLERIRVVLPVKRVELPPREPDQRIAGTEGVVQEGEGMVLRQRDEPERQLGEVDRLGVAVHAVEAALRDLAAGEDRRERGAHDRLGELAGRVVRADRPPIPAESLRPLRSVRPGRESRG